MKIISLRLATAFSASALIAVLAISQRASADVQAPHSPVLVELFTSEGCSSCPPADALLESLDRAGAASGAEAVVLSEHVDYWNHIGWADPFSSPFFSARQRTYAGRLHLESVYTPQMVIDGSLDVIGSDTRLVKAAIARSAQGEKVALRILPRAIDSKRTLGVRVEADALPVGSNARNAQVFLAVALNEAASQVVGGENGGRRLHHVAVVRSIISMGAIEPGVPFAKEISIPLSQQLSAGRVRLVAFIQEKGQGKVIGVGTRIL